MKLKISAIFIIIVLLSACAASKENSGLEGDLIHRVELKIAKMQELIKFDDRQAERLKKIEFEYSEAMRICKESSSCNREITKKRLAAKRDTQLQEILTREQYVKYDAVDGNRIEQREVILK